MNKTLVFTEKETWEIAFRCRNADKSPMDLTEAQVVLHIGHPSGASVEFVDPEITDYYKGEGRFIIPPEQQSQLPPANYHYELRAILAPRIIPTGNNDDKVSSQAQGLFCVAPSRFDEIAATIVEPPMSLVDAFDLKADKATTIVGKGLAVASGTLGAAPTIDVPKATAAEVAAGVNDTKAVTPAALAPSLARFDIATQAEAQAGTVGKLIDAQRMKIDAQGASFDPNILNGVVRSLAVKLRETRSFTDFGAVGDNTTDNFQAFQKALDWMKAGSHRFLHLPEGSYLLNTGVSVTFATSTTVGGIIMEGSVNIAPSVKEGFSIRNTHGGTYKLKVQGGGTTGDFSTATPSGAGTEAFVFCSGRGNVIDIYGRNYQGRVLRIKADDLATTEYRFSNVQLSVYCDSIHAVNVDGASRLAGGVGQAFYINTGITNGVSFGVIWRTIDYWGKYGAVVEDTTDISHIHMEALYRGVSGFEVRGCMSYWGGKILIGSEIGACDLITFKKGSVSLRACTNCQVDHIYAVGGKTGVVLESVNGGNDQGITLNSVMTQENTVEGIRIYNTNQFYVNIVSWNDQVGMHLTGSSNCGTIVRTISGSIKQGSIIDVGVFDVRIEGTGVYLCNSSNTAGIGSEEVAATERIYFENQVWQNGSSVVDYLLKLPVTNKVRMQGGALFPSASTSRLVNRPMLARDVEALPSRTKGVATITAGTVSLIVTHGLIDIPALVTLTPRSTAGVPWVTGLTAASFTINLPSVLGANLDVLWSAEAAYG